MQVWDTRVQRVGVCMSAGIHICMLQVKEVWETFLVCTRLGPQCVEAYVVSMTSAASDVLAVELLKREACRKVCLFGLTEFVGDLPLVCASL